MKTCSKCKITKEDSEFNIRNDRRYPTLRSNCKKCVYATQTIYRENNPEKYAATKRRWREKDYKANGDKRRMEKRLSQYKNFSQDDFLKMLQQQANCCLICGEGFVSTFYTHIDHNHETGVVRGILCRRCNLMLGNARDNPTILVAGADYLTKSLV